MAPRLRYLHSPISEERDADFQEHDIRVKIQSMVIG
jgi:hypothetical protein